MNIIRQFGCLIFGHDWIDVHPINAKHGSLYWRCEYCGKTAR